MKKKITVAMILAASILLLSACANQGPAISVELTEFDFGDVVNGVIAEREVAVRNDGSAALTIESVSTSCGCTRAALEPIVIAPGEQGILRIMFDSGAHGPELTGELVRQVFIRSNDPVSPEVVIEFSANILAGE
jgi:hypothetical protein